MTKERQPEDLRIVPVELSELGHAIARWEEALLRGDIAAITAWMDTWPRWPEQMVAWHSRRMAEAEDTRIRVIHAAIVLLADQMKADLVPDGLVQYACERLATASNGVLEERWLCAALPAQLRLTPPELLGCIIHLFADEAVPVQVVAAAALSGYLTAGDTIDGDVRCGGARVTLLEITQRLRAGVRLGSPLTAAIAARCLVRLRARDNDAELVQTAMIEQLQGSLDVSESYAVIEALEEARPATDEVKDVLFDIAKQEGGDPIVRRLAARVFTRAATATDVEPFLDLLSIDNDAVRRGLIDSITEKTEFEQAVLRAATGYLGSDDPALREIVARALAGWPAGAQQVLPSLIERIGKESDFFALDGLADALASVGSEVAERLMPMLGSRNILVMTAISLVLRRLGASGARVLIRELERQRDLMHRSMMFVVLRDLGPAAREIVPDLARLLLATEDEDYAYVVVQSILASGAAAAALPALIETVLRREGVIAELAATAIRGIGPDAVPQVEAALGSAGAAARDLLERSLMWVPVDARAFARLKTIPSDRIMIFYHAAWIWMEHGKMRLADVAQALQDNRNIPSSVKRSESTLQRVIKEMERAFGRKRLVSGAARCPSNITEHGRTVRAVIGRFARQVGMDLYKDQH